MNKSLCCLNPVTVGFFYSLQLNPILTNTKELNLLKATMGLSLHQGLQRDYFNELKRKEILFSSFYNGEETTAQEVK